MRRSAVWTILRRGPALLSACGVLLLLAGCQPAPPPAAPQPPSQPPPPPALKLRWGTATEMDLAKAFMAAPDSAPAQAAFLAAYGRAMKDLKQASGSAIVPVLLRLWEMNRVTLTTRLSAAEVRKGVGLAEVKAPPGYHPQAAMDQPQKGWRLATPGTFDADIRKVLRAVKTDGGSSYADFVGRWVRYIVDVDDKGLLDPDLPLTCEGIADPLVGTAFIMQSHPITSQRRPPWKIAAALVHEAEHVRWFYELAGQDPRLLFPVPDERNACRAMFLFLKEVRLSGVVGSEGPAIAQDMQEWRGIIGRCNELLGYPPDDLSVRTDLNVPDEILLTDPGCPVPTAAESKTP